MLTSKEQKENKFKGIYINKYIKCKWSKHAQLKEK